MDFKQTEKKFEKLKAQFAAGTLSEADFKTQLEELMLQDEQGSWWMIGYETEQWYRHDGKDWVQTNLPRGFSETSTQKPLTHKIDANHPQARLDDQRSLWKFAIKEVMQSIIGLVVFSLLYSWFSPYDSPHSAIGLQHLWPLSFLVWYSGQ